MSRTRKRDYPRKRDPRRYDYSCLNHGGCPWCEANRQHQDTRARAAAADDLRAHARGDDFNEALEEKIDRAMAALFGPGGERAR